MEPISANEQTPILIYDGDCGFCVYWVEYWKKLTGRSVTYASYQEVGAEYPDISQEEFKRAIWYVLPTGKKARAAEASFLTLAHAPGKNFWLTLYRKLPGFKFFSELAYAFIAKRRPFFHRVSKLLWGRELVLPQYDLMTGIFLRGLGLVYFSAFVSFAAQAMGLIGSHGILPLPGFLSAVETHLGGERFRLLPMLFWFNASDAAIHAVGWGGAAFSLMLALNILPRLSLLMTYVLYLSLLYGGQVFMNYQWDIFLIETGFLALIMTFARMPGIWLLRWLLFRFMFMSGCVKLLSNDPAWADLSALSYHFLTQPLPTSLAWYVAQLPANALVFFTGAMFFIELVLPFLFFFPRRLRFIAGIGTAALEFIIFLTGNYNFFNIQTILMCIVLFDDEALKKIVPARLASVLPRPAPNPRRLMSHSIVALSGLIVFCSVVQMSMRFGAMPPALARVVNESIGPLRIVNTYGLFAVMTTKRHEIVIEGSADGIEWKEYTFKYKPGELDKRPPWNIPHQPRLDWQLWFAALDSPQRLPWFPGFLQRVLENSPSVMALMEKNPFPDAPPRYVRAQYYDYTFASPEEKAKGLWWRRELLGLYFPQASLMKSQ